MTSKLRELGRRSLATAVSATALVALAAAPALADTSEATAQAAELQLLGQTAVTTGQVSATNDGTGQVKSGNTTPALSLLGAQTLLSAGVLAQDAVANSDGTSAACAGVVGAGGLIQIGPSGSCTATPGTPGGVVLNLGLVTITADAIFASCTATANGGTTTGFATIVNGQITGLVPATLPLNPAPNSGVNIPGIATLVLNEQTSTQPGELTVSALHLTLLGNVAELTLGTVTCGPNADTDPIPIFGGARGLVVAVATLAILGTGAWLFRYRRQLVVGG